MIRKSIIKGLKYFYLNIQSSKELMDILDYAIKLNSDNIKKEVLNLDMINFR